MLAIIDDNKKVCVHSFLWIRPAIREFGEGDVIILGNAGRVSWGSMVGGGLIHCHRIWVITMSENVI